MCYNNRNSSEGRSQTLEVEGRKKRTLVYVTYKGELVVEWKNTSVSGSLFHRGDILKWQPSSAPFNSLGGGPKWGGERGRQVGGQKLERKHKKESTRDAEIKWERKREEDSSILMRNNKWPPWPSFPSPSLSTSLTFGSGNWFTVAAVDGGILKMVPPHLINMATCTENMLPWPPLKAFFTMLFTNQ